LMRSIKTGSSIRRRTFLAGGVAALGGSAALGGAWMACGHGWGSDESRLFGLSMRGSDPASVQKAASTGADIGRVPQVLNFYMAWEWRDPFPTATVAAIHKSGAVAEITWEPWNPDRGASQDSYRLDNLSVYDDYVDLFAEGCAAYGGDLVLRFAHEMNSDWYPWSVTANGGSPEAYVAQYRRIRQRFQAAGAHNVRWMWCPNVIYRNRPDLIAASYPGDDVVDIVGVDGYNRGGLSPQELFQPTLEILQGLAPGKQLWIDEVGCIPMPGQAQWVSDLFGYLHTTTVGAVVWFELDTPNAPDWKLLSSPDTASAARQALTDW
jgi:mannan endo-1,4-beta-mannosidase